MNLTLSFVTRMAGGDGLENYYLSVFFDFSIYTYTIVLVKAKNQEHHHTLYDEIIN